MAFKINKQILTSKGVTSEAYVRIGNYQIDKIGKAIFRIDSFLNKESVVEANETPMNPAKAIIAELGEHIHVWLQKDEEVIKKVMYTDVIDIPEEKDEEGLIIKPATKEYKQIEKEETITKKVADLTSVENGTIFQYGYSKLKERLIELFGEENIEEC